MRQPGGLGANEGGYRSSANWPERAIALGLRAAVARVRLLGMSEPIPLWEDWRFWQIVVTGGLAFLGFTFGTWIKHGLDLRLDRIRRDQENRVFAIAFRAELGTLMTDAEDRLDAINDRTTAPADVLAIARFDLPAKPVYANNTHRLGGLGDRVALSVVDAHGTADHIRHNVTATLAYPSKATLPPDYLPGFRRSFLQLIESVETAHNALDVFLGDPERFPVSTDVPTEADDAESAEPDPASAP